MPLVNAAAVVTLIYSEYMQSTIIGCLIGLIIPTFVSGATDSFLYAPTVFLLIKVGSYAVGVLIGFNLLDRVYQILGLQSGLSDILLTLARGYHYCSGARHYHSVPVACDGQSY